MSAIAISGSASTTLPQLNIRPHGHKHGGKVESTDDSSSDTAAQIPVGTAQNAFGSLFQSLEQMIGVQPPTLTTTNGVTTASSPATAGNALTAPGTASTGAAATTPASSASSLLQNYLNNAGQSLPANKVHMSV